MVAVAIGVPILLAIYLILSESLFVTSDLGDSYQRRSQGYLALEQIASRLELSSTQSPGFSTLDGVTFSLPATVGGDATWDPPISYFVQGSQLIRAQSGDTLIVMSGLAPNGLQVTPNGPIMVMSLNCGTLKYAETDVTVSRTVVMPE